MPLQTQVVSFNSANASALDALESLLSRLLPHSLSLLRRIQYARHRGAVTEHARVIFVSPDELTACLAHRDEDLFFTAAFVDVSGGPEPQMWLHSTLEIAEPEREPGDDEAAYGAQLDLVVSAIARLAKSYGRPLQFGDAVLVGSLPERIQALLEGAASHRGGARGRMGLTHRENILYERWLFRAEDLPSGDGEPLEEGLVWDVARESDLEDIISKNPVHRTPEWMKNLPSVVIRARDRTPIAWCFLGPDGTLISIHCEEQYRGLRLARRLAMRIMRIGMTAFPVGEGWAAADVAVDNKPSKTMSVRLNGAPHWKVSWVLLHLPLGSRSKGITEASDRKAKL